MVMVVKASGYELPNTIQPIMIRHQGTKPPQILPFEADARVEVTTRRTKQPMKKYEALGIEYYFYYCQHKCNKRIHES